jgi:drug/metabolite transporter (DMT)-like permease
MAESFGTMAIFLIICMYALWSSVFSLGKIALQCSPLIFLTGFRMTCAGIMILSYLFFTDRTSFKLNRNQYFSLFLLAIFSIYLTNILELWGLKYLSTAKACFIYSLSPFFAVIFSYLHFREKMNGKKWVGLCIGLLGFASVFFKPTDSENSLTAFGLISWPSLALIGATFCSVYGWVLFKLIVKQNDISPITVNGITMLLGGMIALCHSFFAEQWNPLPVSPTNFPSFLKGSLIIIIISNIICYNLYGFLLKRFTATFLSFVGLLSPIFASLNGWFLLNEKLSLSLFVASGILSFGLWLVYQAELKQGYILSKTPA